MALSTLIVWEVRTGGNDLNGGGFKTGASGTDRSQQNAPEATLISSTVHTTTSQINVNVLDYTVVAGDVGNVLQINGGTATLGLYEITAVDTGNNRWTLDRSAGTSAQTVEGRMGGAFGSPGKLDTAMEGLADAKGYIKAGTYTLTTTTQGPGGPINLGNAGQAIEGYNTTRGDLGTAPVIDVGSQNTLTVITLGGSNPKLTNIKVDGQGNASVTGFSVNGAYNCYALDCTTGFTGSNGTQVHKCTTEGCTTGFATVRAAQCEAIGGTTGFTGTANVTCTDCVARACSGIGFSSGSNTITYNNCIAQGCGGDGFDASTSSSPVFVNCVSTNNGGYGFDIAVRSLMINCAGYNNTSGNLDVTPDQSWGFINLSADPWTSSTDLRPNNTAGGGASLRAAGIGPPQQTNNRDRGAVQHTDPAGGGTGIGVLVGGGMVR